MVLWLVAPALALDWESEEVPLVMTDTVDLFADQALDSGYWPSSTDPIAVRFFFTPEVHLVTELDATSGLGWAPLSRSVQGSGLFSMDLDVGVGAEVKLDLFGIYSGVVPIAGTSLALEDEVESDGLWLPGAVETEATLTVDDPGLIPPIEYGVEVIPTVELVLSVGFTPQLATTLAGIEVTTQQDDDLVQQLVESDWVELPLAQDRPGELGLLTSWSGQLDAVLDLVLTPEVRVDTPLGSFTLAEFPLPITLSEISEVRTTAPQFVVHPLPVLADLPAEYAWTSVEVGEIANWPVPIENIGEMLLEGTVTVVGDDAFSVWPPSIAAPPGSESGFVVSFSPEAEGEFEAMLIITTNDPTRPEVQVPLTGTGLVPGSSEGGGDEVPEYEEEGDSATIKTCGCDISRPGSPPRSRCVGVSWGFFALGLATLLYGRRKLPPVTRTQN
jgi:hypothetical protein